MIRTKTQSSISKVTYQFGQEYLNQLPDVLVLFMVAKWTGVGSTQRYRWIFRGYLVSPAYCHFATSYICNRIIQSLFSEGYTLSMSLANMWFSAI